MYSKHFLKYGGMNVRDLEKLIRKSLNLSRFYNSKINYGLTAYNLTSKEAIELQKKDIERSQLDDYLMASASCFPAFKKKDIEGEKHIDGGYHDNLPINLALDMGADEIIAVDFDGTLCFSKWPDCGEPNQALINYLKKWKSDGNKLILWTCRIGEALSNAVDWCRGHGLEFDAVNDNLPEIIEYYGSNSRKITCDWYIDDRNLLPNEMEA